MTPVVLAAKRLEILSQQRSHLDDAVCHSFDFTKPLLVQRRVIEDLGGNAGTVNGRVGIERPDEDLDL